MTETDKSSQPADGGSVAAKESLSFNEVAKLFSVPIAEAASTLGICTSVLKRICRENGIVRWPYRKDTSKSQQGHVPMAGQASQASQQQGSKGQQQGRQNVTQSGHHPKNIPTYLDDFKHGFPANGLSSISTKWWGTGSLDDDETLEEEEHLPNEVDKKPSGELLEDEAAIEEETEGETEKGDRAAALLSSLRKRASEEGREAVKLGVARGYGPYKLRRKERAMLVQIFKSSYPSEWH